MNETNEIKNDNGLFHYGKGSQKKSFDEGDTNLNKFFVCQDIILPTQKQSKRYSSFKDVDEFNKWYEKSGEEANFYETMRNDRVEMYDIDGGFKDDIYKNDEGYMNLEEIIEEFIEARLDFQEDNYKEFPLNRNNFLIKYTPDTGGEKLSLHIIIRNGMKLKNTEDNRKFSNKFYDYIHRNGWKVKFDKSIYSSNRLIRMLGHSKIKQNRYSQRLEGFNTATDSSLKKLFCCSYLEGGEKEYVFEEGKIGEREDMKELQKEEEKLDIKYPTIKYDDDNIQKFYSLIELIIETIEEGKSSISDEENKGKINYNNWYRLVLTSFNCIYENKIFSKRIYEMLFPLYRNCDTIDKEEYFRNLYKDKNKYEKLTINTLHFLARQNNKYEETFTTEIKEYKETIEKLKYIKRLERAKQMERLGKEEYPVKYISEISKLCRLSNRHFFTKEYIEKILNEIICNIVSGGKNVFLCKDNEYCDNSKKWLEKYTLVKYKILEDKGGILNKYLRIINVDWEKNKKLFEKADKEADKVPKKAGRPKKMIDIRFLEPYYKINLGLDLYKDMIENSRVKEYKSIIFKPYLDENEEELKYYNECFNMFRGYSYKIDMNVSVEIYKNSKIRENLRKYLCNGDEEPDNFEFLEKHTAHMIQKPRERCNMAIILQGHQGTGKDLWTTFISKMIGKNHFLDVGNIDLFFKNFNTEHQNKLLTKFNEISDKGIHYEKHTLLKEKITAITTRIEPKGVDSYTIDHFSRYYGFSQDESVVKVENTDRRFCMMKTNNAMANNDTYFKPLLKEIEDTELIQSAFNYYATLNIKGFEPRNFPNTKYRDDQKTMNMPNNIKFCYYLFENNIYENDTYKKHTQDLYNEYILFTQQYGIKMTSNRITFLRDLENLGIEQKRIKINNTTKMGVSVSYGELVELFKIYLKNPNIVIPKLYK